jgi:hypothetical protein
MSGDLAILAIAALCLIVASAAGAFACGQDASEEHCI